MALSPDSPRAARYHKLFQLFDINHDGVVDVNDFSSIEERCATFLPGPAPAFEEVTHAARLRLTQFRKVDSDRDQRVSEAEWLAHCEREFGSAKLGPDAEAFARSFFRSLDVNRDNAIDLGDYCAAHVAHGLNPTVAQLVAGFRALDSNHSGKVNLVEFLAAYTRYCTSDDENVADLLVG